MVSKDGILNGMVKKYFFTKVAQLGVLSNLLATLRIVSLSLLPFPKSSTQVGVYFVLSVKAVHIIKASITCPNGGKHKCIL